MPRGVDRAAIDAAHGAIDDLADPGPVLVARQIRHPGAEIFELDVLAARVDDLGDLEPEHVGERLRQLVAILHRPTAKVRERRQLDWTGADARLDRLLRVGLRPAIDHRHPHRAALDRAVDADAAGFVERPHVTPLGLRACRMRQLLAREPLRALEPVPEEGPDAHVVVVEPHLAIGQDVEARVLLILDHDARCIVERLGVRGDLERFEHVLARELMGEPQRTRVRTHHRRRKQHARGVPRVCARRIITYVLRTRRRRPPQYSLWRCVPR